MIVTFSLPSKVNLLIKKGDQVNLGDKLYRRSSQRKKKLNIAKLLSIKPRNIFGYLEKIIGEDIKKGEVIAVKRGLLGGKKIQSEYNAKLKEIHHDTGEIVLLVDDETHSEIVTSSFKGSVADIMGQGLVVEIKDGERYTAAVASDDGAGRIVRFESAGRFYGITEDEVKGGIVVVEDLADHIEAKCEALGCSGFVYLKGDPYTDLPHCRVATSSDFSKIATSARKLILFTKADRAVVVYE